LPDARCHGGGVRPPEPDHKEYGVTTNETIQPHGGTLVNLLLSAAEAEHAKAEAEHLPKVAVGRRELSDLEMMAVGALSPLTGFQGEKDYRSVLGEMHLEDGLPWAIPVTLSLDEDDTKRIGGASSVALTDDGRVIAVLDVDSIYRRDREAEAQSVFRTTDAAHPGVAALNAAGDYVVAGDVRVIELTPHTTFTKYRLTPAQTRAAFAERGWRTVVGFQTRNPVHRAHEYLQKCAMEIVDGLLLHPLVGETKEDDVPADVRMRCYEILFENYYPKDRAMMSVFPAAMRYAGPREAIWHAICRKNYGCTHFIVGRDHAGVGSYYGTYDAQKIFDEFEPGELGITPLFFEHSFYCVKCEQMASPKTCPHGDEERVILSGTKVREMLREGQKPPMEFSRPEVAQILIDAMQTDPAERNVDPRSLASPGNGET
jgi:sulfate adenylyltransferase